MDMTLPPVSQSPDDLMDLPIADLVRKLDSRVRRAANWVNMAQAESNTKSLEAIRACMRREDTLLHASATALRARAEEASKFAASIGINCDPAFLRKAPHLAACAFVKHVMGEDYGRDK